MTRAIVIAGTDTGIGKTVFAAALAGALDASYWKPIQAGLDGETDSDIVRRLSGLPDERIIPEAYRLRTPASPHLSAERDGVTIDLELLEFSSLSPLGGEGRGEGEHSSTPPPSRERPGEGESGTADGGIPPTTSSCIPPTPIPSPRGGGEALVIELAGGLMVPLTRDNLQIDVVARWVAPVVLVASTRLGTINHTLLSLESLRTRTVPVLGVAFMGDAATDSEAIIAAISGVRRLGRLPRLDPLDAGSLRAAFHDNFRLEDFRA